MTKCNVVANFIGKGWSAVMSLAFIPLYIKYLGMEAYGLIGFNATLSAVISLLDFGMSMTLNREMARLSGHPDRAQEARDLVRTLEWIYWAIAFAIMGIILLGAPYLADRWLYANHLPRATIRQAVVLMGLSIALQWPYSFYEGGLLGLQRQVLLNGISTVVATARGIGAVLALIFIAPTIQVFFVWQIVVSAGMTLAVCFFLWQSLPRTGARAIFQKSALQGVWKFALGVSGIAVVSLVLMQMDKLVLSKMLSLERFGYYMLAANIATGLYYGVTPFATALFPRFVQILSQHDRLALIRLYHRGCQIVSVVILPVAVVMVLFSREIVEVWTRNPQIADRTWLLVSLLVAGYACNAMMNLPYALQLASGWTQLTFTQNLISCILLVPMLFWMTLRYGAVGAAVVWVLLNIGYVLVNIPIMHRRLLPGEQWGWYIRDVGLPLLAALLVGLAARMWLAGQAPPVWLALRLCLIWAVAAMAAVLAAPQARALLRTQVKITF